jgi:hypothetical protein
LNSLPYFEALLYSILTKNTESYAIKSARSVYGVGQLTKSAGKGAGLYWDFALADSSSAKVNPQKMIYQQ